MTGAWRRAGTLATLLLATPGLTVVAFTPAAHAKPSDPKAIELGKKGNQLYADGDFEGAKEAYEKAFAIENDPIFLYGVAQALYQMGDCKHAILKYKQVKESPAVSADMRRFSEEAMVACAEKVATESDDPGDDPGDDPIDDPVADEPRDEAGDDEPGGTAPIEDEPPKERKWYADPLGDTLVALGVVGVGAGIGVIVAGERLPPGDSYEEFDARDRKVRKFRLAGGITLGIGGALLIGGVIRWAVLAARAKNGRTAHVDVLLDGSTAGLSVSGRF